MISKRIPVLVLLIIFIFSLTVQAAATVTPGIDKPVTNPITVTWPQGGEVWQWGTDKTITWKYSPALFKTKTVQILLLKGDKAVETITSGTSVGANGQGSFKWNAITAAPGTGYRIKVVGITSGPAQYDVSDCFTIGEKAKITIVSPKGGERLNAGQQVTIKWTYSGDIGSTLNLRLIHQSDPPNGGLFSVPIDPKAPAGSGGHGSYSWVVPANVPTSATYSIDIGAEYASTGAAGNLFAIVNPNEPPRIKLTFPAGGEVWYKGSTYKITWNYSHNLVKTVNIMLMPVNDPLNPQKIAMNVPIGVNGAGSYSWKIPYDVERRKDYQIWIGNAEYGTFLDASKGNLTINERVN